MADMTSTTSPAPCSPQSPPLGRRLSAILERQVAALEAEPEPEEGGYNEARVKAVQLLTKTFQAVDELVEKQEQANADRDAGPDDIVEFRNDLARRIEALGAGGAGGAVP